MSKTNSHYIRVLVEQARRLELDVERILSETGIDPELTASHEQWVDNDLLTALVKKLWWESNDETMGFDAAPLRIGTWALACEFMLSAETLGDLLRKGEHILSYLPSGSLAIEVREQEDNIALCLGIGPGTKDPDHFLVEFLTVVWHRFPSWAIDENIQLHSAFFRHPRPAHGDFYEEVFQCDIAFEQDNYGFRFSRKYLNRPIVRSKAALDDWLRNSPADLMYLPGRETSMQSQIRARLNTGLQEQLRFPAFDLICESLCTSSQVVRRRLAEEGTSYQQIKDSVRHDLAVELLSVPELRINEIAARTGFTEPAPFSRAFKKWTGMSPAQYRQSKFPE